MSELDPSAVVRLLQVGTFCLFVVVVVRVKPWRWVSSWARRG